MKQVHRIGLGVVGAAIVGMMLLLLVSGFPPFGAAAAEPGSDPNVLRATLPNGLQVVLVRNTLAPVAAISVNYLVGSDDAPDGFPGMAHAQEHMMFRGSPGLSADQLANIGSVMGGNFNANTRENLTQYVFTVPSDDLDIALHIEALRMSGVDDSDKEWANERGAIEQEVAQDLSNSNYVMFAKLREIMFAGTPYEHDALGTRPSFDGTTGAMLKAFYDRWYAPNNAVLVVVGDLDLQATLAKVQQLFGPIPMKRLPGHPGIAPRPLPQTAPLIIPTDQPNGSAVIAFRAPGLDSPDFPALEVLADVLNSQRGALYALVPQGKALATRFSLDPLPTVSMSYATMMYPADGDATAARVLLNDTMRDLLRDGVHPDLVEAAKAQEERETEFQKNSIAGLASVWAQAVAVYNLNSPDEDLDRIRKVTVEDVNRVARQYLNLDQAISATLAPQGTGRPISSASFGGQESIALGEAQSTELPEWAESALSRLSVPQSRVEPIVTTLANGLTLIVQPEDVSDTVTVLGHIKNRPEVEVPAGQEGLSQVVAQLFGYGSEQLNRLALHQALDLIGAQESAGTDFNLQILTRDFDRGVELLADNELHPAFPPDALEVIKGQLSRVVAAQLRSPGYLTQRALREALYPSTDPSLREPSPESVRSLTLEDVKSYYRTVFRPDLATIVVAGHVSPERARTAIEKYFGAWKGQGPKPPIDLPIAPPNSSRTVVVPDANRVQDIVILGQTLGITRADPDYYALELGSAVLGGSFYATRLSIDLRKNAGLVYSVASNMNAGRTRGNYFVQYAADPQNVSKAQAIVVRELARMSDGPVSDEELGRVKALMLRRNILAESSIGNITRGLANRWDLDLPVDEPSRAARRYIALTASDIQAAFRKWIRSEDLVRVTEGPAPE